MLTDDKKIAIVGGGPAGLTLARLLQKKGANVHVYERDAGRHVRVQGATLDLHTESGLAALEEAGLMDAFKTHYRPGADKIRIVDNQARIHFDEHTEESTETFGDEHFRPEIDRGPLRELLLDSLDPDTVVWDSHILALKREGEGWNLLFHNGTSAYADIVIGADGANSRIRPFITPVKAFYSGMTVVEGTVYNAANETPEIFELLKDGKIFAFGDQKTLIVSSKGDGSIAFYTGHKAAEDWVKNSGIDFKDKTQVLAWFKKEFSSWAPVWQQLFDNGSVHFIPRPQYCMPLDQQWEAQSNITMIGDAAHLMPPYAGEGVNMAMQDALELSRCLTDPSFSDLRSAIAAYEEQMRKRASEVAGFTLQNTEWMHAEGALERMLGVFTGE